MAIKKKSAAEGKARRAPKASTHEHDSLRERVLSASVVLIEEEGLQRLSMREVARRAGVTHQAPYHYFKDREEILAAIAGDGFALLDATIADARDHAASPTDALERAAIRYVQFALKHPAHFRVMFRPELVPIEAHESIHERAACAFGHVPAMIAACAEAGLRVEPNVEAHVVMLWSMVHGLACLLLDGPLEHMMPSVRVDPEGAVRDVARAFRRLVEGVMT
jgi:AcrR family transcriptional regulator